MDRREPEGLELNPGSGRGRPFLMAVLVLLATSQASTAQEGSTAAAIGTGALGAYSGATLGLLGGLVPCSTTLRGLLCSRVAAGAGGILGGVSGAAIGSANQAMGQHRFRNAGIGAFIGAGTGLVLQQLVRQYGWMDAGAGALIGGAIGAAPKGAGIGAGVGAALGLSLWAIFPKVEPGDAAALILMGVAVGGLTQWITDAAGAGSSPDRPVPIPVFSIAVP